MLPHLRFDKPAVVTRKIAGLFACFFCLTAIAQNARESAPTKAPQTRPVLTYHNWHGIDEATVFQPFKGSDYDTIAVENFDINGVRLPPAKENTIHAVEQALSDMKPEFIAGVTKKVFLIVDNLSVHEATIVKEWLADKKDRIEVFCLPKYAPERNPDEYLNCDVKANVNTDGLPKDREELTGKLRRFMQKLAKLPARVASYFEHKCIAYAAAPELNTI